MFETITLSDGRNETVHNMQDVLPLIEKYMGFEAYRYVREKLDDLEKELQEARCYFQEYQELRDRTYCLTKDIRDQCNSLEEIIQYEPLDKDEINTVLDGICEAVRAYNG